MFGFIDKDKEPTILRLCNKDALGLDGIDDGALDGSDIGEHGKIMRFEFRLRGLIK
jgi:hypothetical protein